MRLGFSTSKRQTLAGQTTCEGSARLASVVVTAISTNITVNNAGESTPEIQPNIQDDKFSSSRACSSSTRPRLLRAREILGPSCREEAAAELAE